MNDVNPQDLIDLDEELDAEEEEAEFISSSEGFLDHMERTFNEDVLQKQGIDISLAGNTFKFTGLDGKEYNLSQKQKLFVEAYLTFRGNSIDAVISAGYDVRKKDSEGMPINNVYNRQLASVIAHQNLKKLNVNAYMRCLYEAYGFNDEAVEREHLFLINQNEDLKTKRSAIDMYYNVKAKYPAKKMDLTSMGEAIVGVTYVSPTEDKQKSPEEGDQGEGDSTKA